MRIKATRSYLTPGRMAVVKKTRLVSVGEDVEESGQLPTVGNVNWCSYHEIQYGGSSKN